MFDALRKHKPLIHTGNPEQGGRPAEFLKTWREEIPVKVVTNTRNDMALLNLFTKGELKWENTGRTCQECVNFYRDPKTVRGGRCLARNYMEVHPDTPADWRPKGWTDPITGLHIGDGVEGWPACPLFVEKKRLLTR